MPAQHKMWLILKSKITPSKRYIGQLFEKREKMDNEVSERKFPLTSKLSDGAGNFCEFTVTEEQMRQWLKDASPDADGKLRLTFPLNLADSVSPSK